MPIKVACPSCHTSYNLADSMAGKKVRCKKCQAVFPSQARKIKAAEEEDVETGIRSAPSVQDPPAPILLDEDEENEAPPKKAPPPTPRQEAEARRRKARRDDDDDDDEDEAEDDDQPRRRARRQEPMSPLVPIGILVGLVVVIGVVVFLLVRPGDTPAPGENPPLAQGGFPEGNVPVPNVGQNPFPQDPNFPQPQPFPKIEVPIPQNPPIRPDPATLVPVNAAEALAFLQDNDPTARDRALAWLAKADPNVPERPEVAKALESLYVKPPPKGVAEALVNWATRQQVPTLIAIVEDPEFSPWANTRRQTAMLALGNLKDDRAMDALVNRLANPFDRGVARQALDKFGADAKPGLIRNLFHPKAHPEVKTRVEALGVSPKDIYPQAIKDLEQADKRPAVLSWLAQAPVEDSVRGKVLTAVLPLLKDPRPQANAEKTYLRWADKTALPGLIEMLNRPGINPQRKDVIEALVNLKDPDAALAVAGRLADPFNRPDASAGLKKMGPVAEKAVVPFLSHQDPSVRVEAAHVLAEVGTFQSIPFLLTAAKLYPNFLGFHQAVANAIIKIKSR